MPYPKAVWFDFMGTCLDWHSAVVEALPPALGLDQRSHFALELRQHYFDFNAARHNQGLPVLDFDEAQRQVLEQFLATQQSPETQKLFTQGVKDGIIAAWHCQKSWPDVPPAMTKLRDKGVELFVQANGSTRLQLDLVKYAGLRFDMLFSSALLGKHIPHPETFTRVLELLQLKAEDVILVSAHAYHNRGASAVGIKSVYVYRPTDDIREDQEAVKKEFDVYITSMDGLEEAILRIQGI